MTLLTRGDLNDMGFASMGDDIRIDRRAAIFGADAIHLGSHVRIDCYAVITAGPAPVRVSSYTHIAAHTYISGAQGGVSIGYGAGVAPFAAIYSAVEDYTAGHLTNPSVPVDYRAPSVKQVLIGAHAAIGSSSVVLAGVSVGFGASVGALSLVSRPVRPFEVVHGNPIRRTGRRTEARLLDLDARLREEAAAEGAELLDPTGQHHP